MSLVEAAEPPRALPPATRGLGVGDREEKVAPRTEEGRAAHHRGTRVPKMLEHVAGDDDVEGGRRDSVREAVLDVAEDDARPRCDGAAARGGVLGHLHAPRLDVAFELAEEEALSAADVDETVTPVSPQQALGETGVVAVRPPLDIQPIPRADFVDFLVVRGVEALCGRIGPWTVSHTFRARCCRILAPVLEKRTRNWQSRARKSNAATDMAAAVSRSAGP